MHLQLVIVLKGMIEGDNRQVCSQLLAVGAWASALKSSIGMHTLQHIQCSHLS